MSIQRPTFIKWKSVVNLTLLYIISEAVIPAPYQVRGRLVKPGMTKKVKRLLTQYTISW